MTEKCVAQCKDGTDCQAYPVQGSDKCRMHIGTNSDGSSHEGNDNAAKAGAWAEDFYEDFLTEAEQERVEKSADILGDKAGAQEIARHAASVCLEQFRRTGDERFMRRYESLCDKAGIFPEDEMAVDVDQSGELDVTITREVVDADE
jgi:hypothetical protein